MKSAFFATVILLLLCSYGHGAGDWMTDTKSNCKVWNPNPAPSETVSWSGKCVNGYASESGTLMWYQDGKESGSYGGQMKNGKPHGKGTFTWVNGDKYEGDWVDGKRHGKGTFTWVNGDRYEGDWVDEKRHGKGIYTGAKGTRYEGDWFADKRHGKGTYADAEGNKYEGDFVGDKPHGKGTLTSINGEKYVGDFVNGKRQGKGVYTDAKGNKYEGDFVDGKAQGKGQRTGMAAIEQKNQYKDEPAPTGELTDDKIERAVRVHFTRMKGNGKNEWGQFIRNFQIESIDILAKGKWHDEKQWLFVRTRIKAYREGRGPLGGRWVPDPIDDVYEFKVYKDDYGKWGATTEMYTNWGQLN